MQRRITTLSLAATAAALLLTGCAADLTSVDRGPIGSAHDDGVTALEACDATVTAGDSIQAAIDGAAPDDTICVDRGTYAEDVEVTQAVTVRGLHKPRGGRAAIVDGLVDVGADGAAVRSLRVTNSAVQTTDIGGGHGMIVTASHTTVEGNYVTGLRGDAFGADGSFTLHGIHVFSCSGASDITVRNNRIDDIRNAGIPAAGWPNYGGAVGIKVQGNLSDVTVSGNEIDSVHSAGWAYGVSDTASGGCDGWPIDVTVMDNTVGKVNDGTVHDVFANPDAAPYPGVGFVVDESGASLPIDASEVALHRNDFVKPAIGAVNKDAAGEDAQDQQLDATCNWWRSATGPGGIGPGTGKAVSGNVDVDPWLQGPSGSNAPCSSDPGIRRARQT